VVEGHLVERGAAVLLVEVQVARRDLAGVLQELLLQVAVEVPAGLVHQLQAALEDPDVGPRQRLPVRTPEPDQVAGLRGEHRVGAQAGVEQADPLRVCRLSQPLAVVVDDLARDVGLRGVLQQLLDRGAGMGPLDDGHLPLQRRPVQRRPDQLPLHRGRRRGRAGLLAVVVLVTGALVGRDVPTALDDGRRAEQAGHRLVARLALQREDAGRPAATGPGRVPRTGGPVGPARSLTGPLDPRTHAAALHRAHAPYPP
jgi:hypothetical protein